MKKIQIVIDTNIFISALKNDTGASFYLLSLIGKERGQNNFPNYASQLQATFARYQIAKISK